jgi:hypothetical protein
MTKDEELAMDLALEALEKSTDNFPANVQHRKAITAIKQARALDKKAENARELGLDYEPVQVDQSTMELAESVALIGPASRTHDFHAAIQRFHDLICVNATIKAAKMAADAIRESAPLAAPVQKPEWKQIAEDLRLHGLTLVKTATGYTVLKLGAVHAQATLPAQPEAVQEPVAWAHKEGLEKINDFDASIYARGGFDDAVPLYTTQPAAQRPFVGLTDEELNNFLKAVWGREVTPKHFIQAIEAKLKEKNT